MSAEVDILVTEKVMGECAHVLAATETPGRFYCAKCRMGGFDLKADFAGRVVVAPYSTSIVTALAVVEYLRTRTRRIAIDALRDKYEVGMVDPDNEVRGEGKAETLPLAICLAALSFVEAYR